MERVKFQIVIFMFFKCNIAMHVKKKNSYINY